MEKTGPIYLAREGFQRFVRDHYTPRRGEGYGCLSEWLEAWLDDGLGFEYTGRSFETYLRVALDVADAAMRGEIDWNYRGTLDNNFKDGYERKGITALHDPDVDGSHYADRANYEVRLFQWEQEQHREWLSGETAEQ